MLYFYYFLLSLTSSYSLLSVSPAPAATMQRNCQCSALLSGALCPPAALVLLTPVSAHSFAHISSSSCDLLAVKRDAGNGILST